MIEKLIAHIHQRQTEIAFGLCTHPAEDYAKYRQAVGEFKSLQEELEFLNELLGQDES